MTIYAGNISSEVSELELRNVFRTFGQVSFVNLVRDRFQKNTIGFGIIGMPNDVEAQAAIIGLNGIDIRGRALVVNNAGTRTT